MPNRPVFKLDSRLMLCAESVRQGAKIADIGTDHAYLPIWLARQGKISHAIAADLRTEPLKSGDINIKKYHAEDIVETRLSDGLKMIRPEEADDVIIAGMGGELIADIINDAQWLKNPEKRLILQPMTKSERLRKYLCDNGFEIVTENAVISDKKVYSVMVCLYCGKKLLYDDLYLYLGKVANDPSKEADEYISGKITMLTRKYDGLMKAGNTHEAHIYAETIKKIKDILSKRNALK